MSECAHNYTKINVFSADSGSVFESILNLRHQRRALNTAPSIYVSKTKRKIIKTYLQTPSFWAGHCCTSSAPLAPFVNCFLVWVKIKVMICVESETIFSSGSCCFCLDTELCFKLQRACKNVHVKGLLRARNELADSTRLRKWEAALKHSNTTQQDSFRKMNRIYQCVKPIMRRC